MLSARAEAGAVSSAARRRRRKQVSSYSPLLTHLGSFAATNDVSNLWKLHLDKAKNRCRFGPCADWDKKAIDATVCETEILTDSSFTVSQIA